MNVGEIKNHKTANKKLDLIIRKSAMFIKGSLNRVSEQDVCDFILSEFKKENMVTDKIPSIHFVVVNEHTDDTQNWRLTMSPIFII